jgi:transposase
MVRETTQANRPFMEGTTHMTEQNPIVKAVIKAALNLRTAVNSPTHSLNAVDAIIEAWEQTVYAIRQLQRLFSDHNNRIDHLLEGIIPLEQEQIDALGILLYAIELWSRQSFDCSITITKLQRRNLWQLIRAITKLIRSETEKQYEHLTISNEGRYAVLGLLAALDILSLPQPPERPPPTDS